MKKIKSRYFYCFTFYFLFSFLFIFIIFILFLLLFSFSFSFSFLLLFFNFIFIFISAIGLSKADSVGFQENGTYSGTCLCVLRQEGLSDIVISTHCRERIHRNMGGAQIGDRQSMDSPTSIFTIIIFMHYIKACDP